VPKVTWGGVVLVSLVLAACGGGGGDGTFEGEGVTFDYPEDWEQREIDPVTPEATFTTAFAPEEGLSGLIFEIGDAGTRITESNIDAVAEDVAGAIQESTEGPTVLTVAGLPAIRIISHPQSGLTRRITTVFDGATAYVIDCGFTPERAEDMETGCDQVLESFQVE
jgi:hypothetical protein